MGSNEIGGTLSEMVKDPEALLATASVLAPKYYSTQWLGANNPVQHTWDFPARLAQASQLYGNARQQYQTGQMGSGITDLLSGAGAPPPAAGTPYTGGGGMELASAGDPRNDTPGMGDRITAATSQIPTLAQFVQSRPPDQQKAYWRAAGNRDLLGTPRGPNPITAQFEGMRKGPEEAQKLQRQKILGELQTRLEQNPDDQEARGHLNQIMATLDPASREAVSREMQARVSRTGELAIADAYGIPRHFVGTPQYAELSKIKIVQKENIDSSNRLIDALVKQGVPEEQVQHLRAIAGSSHPIPPELLGSASGALQLWQMHQAFPTISTKLQTMQPLDPNEINLVMGKFPLMSQYIAKSQAAATEWKTKVDDTKVQRDRQQLETDQQYLNGSAHNYTTALAEVNAMRDPLKAGVFNLLDPKNPTAGFKPEYQARIDQAERTLAEARAGNRYAINAYRAKYQPDLYVAGTQQQLKAVVDDIMGRPAPPAEKAEKINAAFQRELAYPWYRDQTSVIGQSIPAMTQMRDAALKQAQSATMGPMSPPGAGAAVEGQGGQAGPVLGPPSPVGQQGPVPWKDPADTAGRNLKPVDLRPRQSGAYLTPTDRLVEQRRRAMGMPEYEAKSPAEQVTPPGAKPTASAKPTPFADEAPTIQQIATEAGVDPRLLAAIRTAEGGRAGREFGVMGPDGKPDPSAPDFLSQGQRAAGIIKSTMAKYQQATGQSPMRPDGTLSQEFLTYLSRGGPGYPGYAPIGAGNDPTNLNPNHLPNLMRAYYGAVVAPPTPVGAGIQ